MSNTVRCPVCQVDHPVEVRGECHEGIHLVVPPQLCPAAPGGIIGHGRPRHRQGVKATFQDCDFRGARSPRGMVVNDSPVPMEIVIDGLKAANDSPFLTGDFSAIIRNVEYLDPPIRPKNDE